MQPTRSHVHQKEVNDKRWRKVFEYLCQREVKAKLARLHEKQRVFNADLKESAVASTQEAQKVARRVDELQEKLDKSICADTCITIPDLWITGGKKHWSKNQVQWMVWEADEDADGRIGWEDFKLAVMRCEADKQHLEPRLLYHFVLFLLCDFEHNSAVPLSDLSAELRCHPGTENIADKIDKILKDEKKAGIDVHLLTVDSYLQLIYADLPATFTSALS